MVTIQATALVLSLVLLVGSLLLLYHRLHGDAVLLLLEAERTIQGFVKAQNDVINTINILLTGNVEEGERQKPVVSKGDGSEGSDEGSIIANHRANMKPGGGTI